MAANLLFIAIPALIATAISRGPFLYTMTEPSGTKPWADSPMKLVSTPQFETKKTDIFTTGATHMALLHNSILRGYNSIYQQAPHVRDEDKASFVGYALTWYKFVKSHHDDEEAVLFAKVEEILDDHDIWAGTHKEHEAFLPGLGEYHTYLSTLPSANQFSPSQLRTIMSSFEESFQSHFHSEIKTIASLAEHPNAPPAGSEAEANASALFKAWGKTTVAKAGTFDVVPFFLLNLDGTFEEGQWANWPPMPNPIRWGLANIAGAVRGPWWKFSSCNGAGSPKELYALQFPERKD